MRRAAHPPAGFTLVEILVVVVILGVAAAVGALSLRPDERGTVTRETRQLAGAIEHAIARAQLRSETLGVSAENGSWRFWRYLLDENRWLPLTDDDVLSTHAVAEGLKLVPRGYAGQGIALGAVIPLRASGRNEPFSVEVDSANVRMVLAIDPLNRVTIAALP